MIENMRLIAALAEARAEATALRGMIARLVDWKKHPGVVASFGFAAVRGVGRVSEEEAKGIDAMWAEAAALAGKEAGNAE